MRRQQWAVGAVHPMSTWWSAWSALRSAWSSWLPLLLVCMLSSLAVRADAMVSCSGRLRHAYRLHEALELSEQTML